MKLDYLISNTDDSRPITEIVQNPDFSSAFEASNLGDAIVRIVNICAEFGLSDDVMFEMIRKAKDKYGLPGGAGGVAAHGPDYPGSGVLEDEEI
ncbi:hypothetical protein P6N53_13135 [Desulforamulus aquiferis]|uniref:Uncharacterized protein n=1 Tax=Desulforamulus aquiferis TaxID=1397668 RepID=A0AAW7ZEM5_9FIRM|nr:hypothetical protein [Desulforamulus aquiferis]